MNKLFAKACELLWVLLVLLVSLFLPARAQTAATAAKSAGPLTYDITREITLGGTVTSLLPKAPTGMISGSHLLLTTSAGTIDISLGAFGLKGKGALSVDLGQHIEVVGVMKNVTDKQILLARTVKAGARVYLIRNEHGIPVPPQARERAGKNNAQDRNTL